MLTSNNVGEGNWPRLQPHEQKGELQLQGKNKKKQKRNF